MNKNQAAREVRQCADALIEQLERLDKGWDQGRYRDDTCAVDRNWGNSINYRMDYFVNRAFALSREFN